MRVAIVILLVGATIFTSALEPFEQFREGSCSQSPVRPVKASREFVDSLTYLAGGSKYHMYRTAFAMPNFRSMSEDDLIHDACYTRNTTTTIENSISGVFGFDGRVLNTFRVVTRPGIYFVAAPRQPGPNSAWGTVTVTLTDNKSFAVLFICWTGVGLEERAWAVVTNSPYMDFTTRKVVEEHAVSLGFKRENFVFLSYDRCHRDNPILDRQGLGHRRGRYGRSIS